MILTHALNGDKDAARWLSPSNPDQAANIAFEIMKTKLATYLQFNATYPGFGGYLPWFLSNSTPVTPTSDWVNRVPALDNGELIWAVYGAVHVLSSCSNGQWKELAASWKSWLDLTAANAARIFYRGNGIVCAVATLNQSLSPTDSAQNYSCEGSSTLNDPYEGELFAWWLYFFGGVSSSDKAAIWAIKAPQLVRREYKMGNIGPVTVQEGFWFSAHEQWKTLEMPYLHVPLINRLFLNGERVRTCNSVVTRVPGMFASVNNSTDPTTGQIIGYISDAGIPSISNQTTFELDVITPYSVFPVMLFDKPVAFAWYHNMLVGKKMQNPYGSTESTRVDGTGVSSFVSWDSKITTVAAYLGGVYDIVAEKMKRDGIYEEFVDVIGKVYRDKFAEPLLGEDQQLCLPSVAVPDAGLKDYSDCA
jgi:hypothetical protein